MSPDPADRVAGIVLAAGTSTRMGHNKLFVELEGETLVYRTARRVADAGLDPVIVVVGHESERVRDAIGTLPCRLVLNPDYLRGVNSSLRVGIRAASEEAARAAVVVLGDMPFDGMAPVNLTFVEDGSFVGNGGCDMIWGSYEVRGDTFRIIDLEAGERFYSELLGFPVVERWSSRGGAIWVMNSATPRLTGTDSATAISAV